MTRDPARLRALNESLYHLRRDGELPVGWCWGVVVGLKVVFRSDWHAQATDAAIIATDGGHVTARIRMVPSEAA